MWTVAEVIKEARGIHPAFTDRQTPVEVARQEVDRYTTELRSEILKVEPDFFDAEKEYSFPLSDFDGGEALPADFHRPKDGTVHFENDQGRTQLNLVPFGARFSPGVPWAAYIKASTIRFIGEESDWEHVDKVVLYYLPTKTPLASKDDTSDLPDTAKPAVVSRLALFMAGRGPEGQSQAPIQIPLTHDDWKESERRFLNEVSTGLSDAEQGYVREVW